MTYKCIMRVFVCVFITLCRAEDCMIDIDEMCSCELLENRMNIKCQYSNDNVSLPIISNNNTENYNIHRLLVDSSNLTSLPDNYFQHINSIYFLDMHNNSFTQVPVAVDSIETITSLDFSYNNLQYLNFSSFYKNKTSITISNYTFSFNVLENIFVEVNQTTYVECLNISNNRLKDIPDALWPMSISLDLSNNLLHMLPELPESKLKHLYLHDNKIQTVTNRAFQNVNLLEELYLNNNKITNLMHDTFEGLELLTNLKLDENFLSKLNNSIFIPLKSLMKLDISVNKVQIIHSNTFSGLEDNLQELIISNNNLSELANNSFQKLENLRLLDLSFNKNVRDISHLILPLHLTSFMVRHCSLSSIRDCRFLKLKDIQNLNLAENEFICSCHLSLLHAWFRTKQHNENIPISYDPDEKWMCKHSSEGQLSVVSANITNCGSYLDIEEHCIADFKLLQNTSPVNVQVAVNSMNNRVNATWIVHGNLAIVWGFMVSFESKENILYQTPILEKTQSSFTVSDNLEASSYDVCVHVMANASFILDSACQSMSNFSLDYVIGIMAGVIFLVPCLAALIYILRKDKMMKQLVYAPIPVGVPIVKEKGGPGITSNSVIVIPGDTQQALTSDFESAVCPYHENKAFEGQLSDEPCSSDAESDVVVIVTPPCDDINSAVASEDTNL